jgi:Peptidase M61 N-terminal domain
MNTHAALKAAQSFMNGEGKRKIIKRKHPQPKFPLRWLVAALTLSGLALAARAAEPIIYTVKFPAPDTRIAEVEAAFPTGRRAIELMMPVWSPGFYRVED